MICITTNKNYTVNQPIYSINNSGSVSINDELLRDGSIVAVIAQDKLNTRQYYHYLATNIYKASYEGDGFYIAIDRYADKTNCPILGYNKKHKYTCCHGFYLEPSDKKQDASICLFFGDNANYFIDDSAILFYNGRSLQIDRFAQYEDCIFGSTVEKCDIYIVECSDPQHTQGQYDFAFLIYTDLHEVNVCALQLKNLTASKIFQTEDIEVVAHLTDYEGEDIDDELSNLVNGNTFILANPKQKEEDVYSVADILYKADIVREFKEIVISQI